MFGTMGFSELMIILVIILIIFGAGRLPQIGEGVGKALKGFKKEVADLPSAMDPNDPQEATGEPVGNTSATASQPATPENPQVGQPANQPYQPGPEQTPGTAAALLYQGAGPKPAQQPGNASNVSASAPSQPSNTVPGPMSMEDRQAQPVPTASAQYPPLPPGAQAKPIAKRPSAIVNKQAVARVQAQQAARKEAQAATTAPQDMQSLGEGLGSAVRTFRDAAADIKNSIDPQMRTIQAEMEAAELEMKESIEAAKQPLAPKEPSGSV